MIYNNLTPNSIREICNTLLDYEKNTLWKINIYKKNDNSYYCILEYSNSEPKRGDSVEEDINNIILINDKLMEFAAMLELNLVVNFDLKYDIEHDLKPIINSSYRVIKDDIDVDKEINRIAESLLSDKDKCLNKLKDIKKIIDIDIEKATNDNSELPFYTWKTDLFIKKKRQTSNKFGYSKVSIVEVINELIDLFEKI